MVAESIERATMFKLGRRIVPLMAAALFCSYLDKVNLGFAALQMNEDLGFSNSDFGAGAGFFAVGYALAGIPSALLMHRFGARRWISAIMIAWGLASAATALVTRPQELILVRLLLGIAEAGFSPGVVLYFSAWFPNEYRGRVLSSFFMIGPVGLLVAGPVSSALLSLDGWLGIAGWQWLFIIEALPTFLIAFVVLRLLRDNPADAHWLTQPERDWLQQRLASARRAIETTHVGRSVWHTLADTRVWTLALVYLGLGTSGIGATFFLPLMIQSMGFSIWSTGFITALPAALGLLALPLWGMWADRARVREAIVAVTCCTIAAGMVGTAMLLPSAWALLPLSLVFVGFYGCVPTFWTLPSVFLVGAHAAAGIAFINIAGNLGNFTGPALLGWMSDLTHSYALGLMCLAAAAAGAAAIMTTHIFPKARALQPQPSRLGRS